MRLPAGVAVGRSVLDLGKGHAEHLITVIAAALAAAGKGLFGPRRHRRFGRPWLVHRHSRTRGFRGAGASRWRFGIPAIGVNTLEALAAEVREAGGAKPCHGRADFRTGKCPPFSLAFTMNSEAWRHAPGMMTLRVAAELASQHQGGTCRNRCPPDFRALPDRPVASESNGRCRCLRTGCHCQGRGRQTSPARDPPRAGRQAAGAVFVLPRRQS